MHWSDLFNSGASLFIVATASTKTMVPLRILAIVTNCILVAFYGSTHAWIPMALQVFALPLNAYRLYQMIVSDPKRARSDPRQAVAGLAQAVHGGTPFQERRPPVCERRGRGPDVLHHDRPLRARRARHRDPARPGRRRTRDAGAGQSPHGDPRMHRGRRRACRSPTNKSRSFTTRTRHSAFTFCAWRRRGCSTISTGCGANWNAARRRLPVSRQIHDIVAV